MKNLNGAPQEVAVLITIHQYYRITANMTAEEIHDFMINYHTALKSITLEAQDPADEFEPFAGDFIYCHIQTTGR